MDKKYFVLFTSLFVYVNSHLIEFMDSTPRHISNTFMTDIYAFILFILGVLYFALCQLKVDKKQKQLINICIFYTIAFPLLSLRTMYLDSNFDIQFSVGLQSLFLTGEHHFSL